MFVIYKSGLLNCLNKWKTYNPLCIGLSLNLMNLKSGLLSWSSCQHSWMLLTIKLSHFSTDVSGLNIKFSGGFFNISMISAIRTTSSFQHVRHLSSVNGMDYYPMQLIAIQYKFNWHVTFGGIRCVSPWTSSSVCFIQDNGEWVDITLWRALRWTIWIS